MSGYTPPFGINDTMLTLISSISEKLGMVTATEAQITRPRLRRIGHIRSVHASLRIEANSLSLSEVRDVIDGHPVIGDPTEIAEVRNAYAAYSRLGSFDPYELSALLQLHGCMTRGLIRESGCFRTGPEGVYSNGRIIFVAPPADLVSGQMKELFEWMSRVRGTVHPLILSSVFHYAFVFIHPFADGNGRMARLWQTALLAEWRPIFAELPIESRIEACQEEYYSAIAACHRNGSSDTLIEFLLRMIDEALEERLGSAVDLPEADDPYVQRLLSVMQPGTPYTTAALMQLLGLRSRSTFRKTYLVPALRQGLLQMTLPDTPSSRNQRYIRTR